MLVTPEEIQTWTKMPRSVAFQLCQGRGPQAAVTYEALFQIYLCLGHNSRTASSLALMRTGQRHPLLVDNFEPPKDET